MIREGLLVNIDHKTACKNLVKAASKGVVKVMSKMGISAIQSYRGAQVFEALGIRQDVIDHYFTWTASRVGGVGLDVIAQEVLTRHRAAYPDRQVNGHVLPVGGIYQWRSDGEAHLFSPESIHKLQKAARNANYAAFKEYAQAGQRAGQKPLHVAQPARLQAHHRDPAQRGRADRDDREARFKTGAMLVRLPISSEAHETLAIAMNRIGGKSNTGEGGEDPARFIPMANGDLAQEFRDQAGRRPGASGVTSEYLM